MAERPTMPTFVPRTVASFERTATAVARRVAAPVRMLATRALSFADRLMGSWAGAGPTVGGLEHGQRPAMRVAERGGGMPMPRPWYEVEADEDVIWPQQVAAAPAGSRDAPAAATAAAAVAAVAAARVTPAAERGGSIARTNVTAPPELTPRQSTQPSGPTASAPASNATTANATIAATTTTTEAAGAKAPANATVEANSGARDASAETRDLAAGADVRVAEALGLRALVVVPTVATVERATTPLGRALAHAAWVDAQLRTLTTATTTAPVGPARATAGYVFAAPAAKPTDTTTTATGEPTVRAASVPPAMAAMAAMAAPAKRVEVAAWSARLPDPRLPETMPTAAVERAAAFVARLVGVEAARDAAALPTAAATPAGPMAVSTVESRVNAPVSAIMRAAPEAMYVALPAVSWRPGAAGARVEQLGARVDARVNAAWGEPTATVTTTSVPGATTSVPVAETSLPVVVTTSAPAQAAASSTRAVPSIAPIYVTPEVARATGPARMAAFVQQLVGVQAAQATAPLPVQTLVSAAAPASAASPVSAASARVPERVALTATTTAPPTLSPGVQLAEPRMSETLAPGGVGRRAEQLGGVVGVRAANLSIDFVDPARFAQLTSVAPSLPVVAPAAQAEATQTIMPAPRPLFVATPAPAAATLSAEEWSLVSTFPSAAMAVQLAAGRQSQQWSDAAPAGAGTGDVSALARAERRGVATEYVAPTAAPPSRLPSGRVPRGSFTWPKLAEPAPARAEWSASPTLAVAEQTREMALGTPLWGALPALDTVSPTLAASAGLPTTTPTAATAAQTVRTASGATGPDASRSNDAAAGSATTAPGPRGDAPAMTLMTAAARREARAVALGAREPGADERGGEGAELAAPSATMQTARPVSNVRAPATMTLPTAAAGPTGAAGRAFELARPFLRLVEGGLGAASSDGGARASAAPRFFEQPQPVVAGAPSSDSASRIVEALRSQPTTTAAGDDRVSLADLTLIAIASATSQVAASPTGGGPSGGASSAAPAATAAASGGGHGGGGKSENPAQEVEELARAAFDELQRLFAMARERSGDHG